MYSNLILAICSFLTLSRMCHGISADQCPAQEPIYWKALKGYTFKTLLGSSPFECLYHCHYEVRCQSYNYVIKNDICEMNNRTKEAKPEQFVSDSHRFYMKRGAHRVALGSTPSLPAESCKEIKANEAGEAVSGNSWLDPTGSGEVILAHCDMNTEVADFCARHHCLNGASCVNGHVNYTYLCDVQWTGTYCEIAVIKGLQPNYPALSCKEIRNITSSNINGEYWIDPEGTGSSFKVYCDMTTDGGGWLLVLNVVIGSSPHPQLSLVTSYRQISGYYSNKMVITKSAMNELSSHLSYTQLRFHCSKQQGRTFHVTTAANSTGNAVVQYFSGQMDIYPEACNSFVRMENDNSMLAAVCYDWGSMNGVKKVGKWGADFSWSEGRLYDHAAWVSSAYHWLIKPARKRWECDDFRAEVSSGDFWKVYVR